MRGVGSQWQLAVAVALLAGCGEGVPAAGRSPEEECAARGAGWSWQGACVQQAQPPQCAAGEAAYQGACEPAYQRVAVSAELDAKVEAFTAIASGRKTLHALVRPSIATVNGMPSLGFARLPSGGATANVQFALDLPPAVEGAVREHARARGWEYQRARVDAASLRVNAGGQTYAGTEGRVVFRYGDLSGLLALGMTLLPAEASAWEAALADGSATPEDLLTLTVAQDVAGHVELRTQPLRVVCLLRTPEGALTRRTDTAACREYWRVD